MEVINNKNLFNQPRGKKYFEDKKIAYITCKKLN